MQRVTGFTLVELLIALAILAIVVGIAVPSFQALLHRGGGTATSNQLLGALLLARSEAVKRVSLDALSPTVGGGTVTGWQVPDNANVVLLTHTLESATIGITATGNAGSVTYRSNGRSGTSLAAATDFLTISDGDASRKMCLSPSGRPSIIDGGGNC
ncbi:MAG: prepilin-type N-terminal cleavage/methylation domain-containing protein [Planctomycetaceae bacterium]|nr:prepilin-type N-terminal cleavage/methylation domain-containing protein [Planctomycetaceae bacterium]